MSTAILEGPKFTFEVEAAKIREFATALGAVDAIHVDRQAAIEAGYRDIVAPIGLVVWTIVQNRDVLFEQFGLAADRGLAGSEGWDFLEPICAGDRLDGRTCRTAIETKEARSGPMTLHRLETRYSNQLGKLALVERTTIMQWQRSPFALQEQGRT